MSEQMKRFFQERDALASRLGAVLTEVEPGRAVATMEVTPDHHNCYGVAHGGAIFALADFVFCAASNSHGRVAVALNVTISYLRAVGADTLTAEAKEISLSHRIGTYEIAITNGAGEDVALFLGTAYRKSDKVPWEQEAS
jgi:acyl-CoA thioesterase